MDREFTLEIVRVTEFAAIAAAKLRGKGDEKLADQAAVDAMRTQLNSIKMFGTVVIGEGERDEAPMLYIGEKVGAGNGPEADIALDPLEGTTLCAKSMPNALAVIAVSESGGMLNAPDTYMDKIAVGPGYSEDIINTIEKLKSRGIKVVSIEQADKSLKIENFKPVRDHKYAFIFGNEVDGIQDEIIKISDEVVEIPQVGTKHSLNVSVAAGIVLWDFFYKTEI